MRILGVIQKRTVGRFETPRKYVGGEALEEAGITGDVPKCPLGFYTYVKDGRVLPLVVMVFTLQVKGRAKQFS